MPREQAFSAAQRLKNSGTPRDRLLTELLELGFSADDAKVAIHALDPPGETPDQRWGNDELRRARLHAGYMRILVSVLLILGGGMLALATGSFIGVGLAILGLVLLGSGLWTMARSQVG